MNNLDGIQFLKGSARYQRAPERTISIQIPISGKQKEIDEYQRNLSINLSEVYNMERQESTLFEPTCKFQLIFSNAYSGVASNSTGVYFPYNNFLYYLNPTESKANQVNSVTPIAWAGFPQYNEFSFIRKDIGLQGYTLGATGHITLEPRLASNYNWNFYLSYPHSNNYDRILSYNFGTGSFSWTPSDGLPALMQQVVTEGKTYWQFKCAVNHNLKAGEYVKFSNVSVVDSLGDVSPKGNIFEVYSLGNGIFDSEKTIFNILDVGYYQDFSNSFSPDKLTFFHRIINRDNPIESRSEYYVRRHTLITSYDDFVMTNSGFEQNAFRTVKKYESADLTPNQKSRVSIKEDSQSYNLSFNNSIDINGLVDNLNRPVSELFITVINRGYFGYFNPPVSDLPSTALKEGWEFNISTTNSSWWQRNNIFSNTSIPVDSFIANGRQFFRNRVLNSGVTLNGDLCEWNNLTQLETVLSDCYHKFVFNPEVFNIGGSLNNPLGYYYKPIYSIKIKQFSDYIEEGSTETTDGIPSYAYYSQSENTFFWRDIYSYGFIDSDGNGVNFPFMNGRHYPYDNFIFRIIPEGSNLGTTNYVEVETPTIDGCE